MPSRPRRTSVGNASGASLALGLAASLRPFRKEVCGEPADIARLRSKPGQAEVFRAGAAHTSKAGGSC